MAGCGMEVLVVCAVHEWSEEESSATTARPNHHRRTRLERAAGLPRSSPKGKPPLRSVTSAGHVPRVWPDVDLLDCTSPSVMSASPLLCCVHPCPSFTRLVCLCPATGRPRARLTVSSRSASWGRPGGLVVLTQRRNMVGRPPPPSRSRACVATCMVTEEPS